MAGFMQRLGFSKGKTSIQKNGPKPAPPPAAYQPQPPTAGQQNIPKGHPVYRSYPLGPNQLRVLHVQPAASLESPVVARLSVETYSPKKNIMSCRYEALSYTWGKGTQDASIFINNSEVGVTRNLDSALRHLRRSHGELIIWADAICINQKDDDEREAQVAMMGTIYRKAVHVRIWAGDAAVDAAAAMQLVKDCGGEPNHSFIAKQVGRNQRGAVALAEILRRPYWNRMWVFQEIILSTWASVHCGVYSAPWDNFIAMSMAARQASKGWTAELQRAFASATVFTVVGGQLADVDKILLVTRRLRAKDARDKLYALMTTCDMAPFLEIDYDKPARDVYVGFTRRHAEVTGRLSVMLSAGWHNSSSRAEGSLPTWTPDFDPVDLGKLDGDMLVSFGHGTNVFNACGGRPFRGRRPGADAYGGVLETEGFIMGTVQATTPLIAGAGRSQTTGAFDLRRMAGSNPSGKAQLQAFFETITLNREGLRQGPDGIALRQGRLFNNLLGLVRDMDVHHGGALPRKQGGLLDLPALLGPDANRLAALVEAYEVAQRSNPKVLEDHRGVFVRDYEAWAGSCSAVFVTGDNYFGRGNMGIRRGDVLAVLFGCAMPVVLRRCQAGFQFVGPCYVGGIMFGELMDGSRPQLKVQRIPLV